MMADTRSRIPAVLVVVEQNSMLALPLAFGCMGVGIAAVMFVLSGFRVLSPAAYGWLVGTSLLLCLGGSLILAWRVRAVRRLFRVGASTVGTITRITDDGTMTILGKLRLRKNVIRYCWFEYEWGGIRYRSWQMFESVVLQQDLSVGDDVIVVLNPQRPRSAVLEMLYVHDTQGADPSSCASDNRNKDAQGSVATDEHQTDANGHGQRSPPPK
jgi:hypothetical protein